MFQVASFPSSPCVTESWVGPGNEASVSLSSRKVYHWTFIEGWESYTLGICMNVWCVYEARMSLTLEVQSRSTLNELKIRIRMVFNFYLEQLMDWTTKEKVEHEGNLLTLEKFPSYQVTFAVARCALGNICCGSVHPR